MLLVMSTLLLWKKAASQSNIPNETEVYRTRTLSILGFFERATVLSYYIVYQTGHLYLEFVSTSASRSPRRSCLCNDGKGVQFPHRKLNAQV